MYLVYLGRAFEVYGFVFCFIPLHCHHVVSYSYYIIIQRCILQAMHGAISEPVMKANKCLFWCHSTWERGGEQVARENAGCSRLEKREKQKEKKEKK